jgi:hypothetical protein
MSCWCSPKTACRRGEVRYDVPQSPARGSELIVRGPADTFDAAKAAALHEASTRTVAKPAHRR